MKSDRNLKDLLFVNMENAGGRRNTIESGDECDDELEFPEEEIEPLTSYADASPGVEPEVKSRPDEGASKDEVFVDVPETKQEFEDEVS